MSRRLVRCVQLGQRDPAGRELGVRRIRPDGQATVGGCAIGAAGVSGAQRRQHQPLALVPDPVALIGGGDLVGEVGGQHQGQRVQPLAAQVGGALEGDAGRQGHVGGQGGDLFVGVPGLGAQRHADLGGGLLFGGQQGDHLARRRPQRAIEQHIGAPGVVLGGQHVAETGQHGPLWIGLETLAAPPAADQRGGLRRAVQPAIGGGQRHRPLRRRRSGRAEPVDHLLRGLAGRLDLPLRRGLAFGRAGPSGEIAARDVHLVEAEGIGVGIHQGPGRGLARQRVGQAGDRPARVADLAMPGGFDGLAKLRRVAGRQRMRNGVRGRRDVQRRGSGHGVQQIAQRISRLGARGDARHHDDAGYQQGFTRDRVQRAPQGTSRESIRTLRARASPPYCPANPERRFNKAFVHGNLRETCQILCSRASSRRW